MNKKPNAQFYVTGDQSLDLLVYLRTVSGDVVAYLMFVPLPHGPRSLQRILQASDITGAKRLQAHHLPPEEVIGVHVDQHQHNTCAQLLNKLRTGAEMIDLEEPLRLKRDK